MKREHVQQITLEKVEFNNGVKVMYAFSLY